MRVGRCLGEDAAPTVSIAVMDDGPRFVVQDGPLQLQANRVVDVVERSHRFVESPDSVVERTCDAEAKTGTNLEMRRKREHGKTVELVTHSRPRFVQTRQLCTRSHQLVILERPGNDFEKRCCHHVVGIDEDDVVPPRRCDAAISRVPRPWALARLDHREVDSVHVLVRNRGAVVRGAVVSHDQMPVTAVRLRRERVELLSQRLSRIQAGQDDAQPEGCLVITQMLISPFAFPVMKGRTKRAAIAATAVLGRPSTTTRTSRRL